MFSISRHFNPVTLDTLLRQSRALLLYTYIKLDKDLLELVLSVFLCIAALIFYLFYLFRHLKNYNVVKDNKL